MDMNIMYFNLVYLFLFNVTTVYGHTVGLFPSKIYNDNWFLGPTCIKLELYSQQNLMPWIFLSLLVDYNL